MQSLAWNSTEITEQREEIPWCVPTLQSPFSALHWSIQLEFNSRRKLGGLILPHHNTELSRGKARNGCENKQAQNWPIFYLIQVLLLIYWGNLDNLFPFSVLPLSVKSESWTIVSNVVMIPGQSLCCSPFHL